MYALGGEFHVSCNITTVTLKRITCNKTCISWEICVQTKPCTLWSQTLWISWKEKRQQFTCTHFRISKKSRAFKNGTLNVEVELQSFYISKMFNPIVKLHSSQLNHRAIEI